MTFVNTKNAWVYPYISSGFSFVEKRNEPGDLQLFLDRVKIELCSVQYVPWDSTLEIFIIYKVLPKKKKKNYFLLTSTVHLEIIYNDLTKDSTKYLLQDTDQI